MHLNNRLVIRVLVAAFVALGLFVRSINADPKSDQQLQAFREGKTIKLPPFMVTEENAQKGARPWVYLSTPGLEVLSKCNDGTTLWFAEQYIQRQKELEEILPSSLQFEHPVPTAIILITPDMEKTMSSEVLKIMESQDGERSSRVTAGGRETSFYAMVPQVNFTDSESTATMLEQADNDHRAISLTTEYVLNALQRRTPSLPYWFQSNMFSFYQQIRWSDRDALAIPSVYWPTVRVYVTAGTPNPKGYKVLKDDSDKLYRNEPVPLIPIRNFLAGPFGGEQPGSQYQLDLWHYEGSLFLYWVFADETHARRKALWDFVDKSSHELSSEALFQQCFGMNFADMTKELSDYLPQAQKAPLNLLKVDSVAIPGLHLINADPVTRARIQGDFVLKEMRYMAKGPLISYVPLYAAKAETILLKPYRDGSHDPALMSVIGLYYAYTGKDDEASAFLQEAVKSHVVVRPSVYGELARIQKTALSQSTTGKGFTSDQ